MSTRREILVELYRALAMDVEAGRGRVLDAELKMKLDALVSQAAAAESDTSRRTSAASRAAPTALRAAPPAPGAAAPASRAASPASGAASPASGVAPSADRGPRMAALAARAESCTRCGLHATRNRVVTGVGDLDAALMLVGEAPGHDEDQTGEPFVGRAGQLLNRILAAIGLDRREVYIANVLKCRPPDNRPPAPVEIATCSPFLFEQIEIVRPRVICALGRYAAMTLLGTKKSLAELRGRVHDFRGTPLVITYHPSALLRDPSYKRPTWEDMQIVQRLLGGTSAAEPLVAGGATSHPVI